MQIKRNHCHQINWRPVKYALHTIYLNLILRQEDNLYDLENKKLTLCASIITFNTGYMIFCFGFPSSFFLLLCHALTANIFSKDRNFL